MKQIAVYIIFSLFSVLFILSLIILQCGRAMSHQIASEPTSVNLAKAPEIEVGIQLWSVREDLKQDFEGTLKAIADMGFDAVEFAGDFGGFAEDPAGLKKFLSSLGLKANSAHTVFTTLTEDKVTETLSFYQTLGIKMLIIGYDDRAFDITTVGQTIDDLNRVYPQARAHGLQLGYHNHAQEFATVDGKTLWDRIAEGTADDLVMQLDASWARKAGKDPVEYVHKHPGRTLTSHFKAAAMHPENGEIPIIGADTIDWICLLDAVYTVGGAQGIVMEQEEYPNNLTPLQAVKLSKLALDGFVLRYQYDKTAAKRCSAY